MDDDKAKNTEISLSKPLGYQKLKAGAQPGDKPTEEEQRQAMALGIIICLAIFACLFFVFFSSKSKGPDDSKTRLQADEKVSQDLVTLERISRFSLDDMLQKAMQSNSSQNYSQGQAFTSRALAMASTEAEAMKLIAYGDRYLQEGKYGLAEHYYRRALQIFAASPTGSHSQAYIDALMRLSRVFHELKRYEEEIEINNFIRRIEGQTKDR